MNIIETRNLVRYFGTTPAVVELDLAVPQGSVYGLLGENASGKTTTLNLIMGALVPNDGTVSILGEDPLTMPAATRARIGYVADEMGVPDWMKLSEAKNIHASYFQTWDSDLYTRLMSDYALREDRRFGTLSKGQKRRFILTLIVSQRPEVLILDEPAGGLDTAVRRQFLDLLIEQASERDITVLLSSHILSDVERVVDHVAFIKAGRLVTQSGLEDLKMRVKRLCLSMDTPDDAVRGRFNILGTVLRPDTQLIVVDDFEAEKLDGIDCRVEHLNLEELFLVYNQLDPRGKVNV